MTSGVCLDLHVHSDQSPDSRLSLDAIVARITSLGLNGFALTDHNTIDGHPALRRLAQQRPDLILVAGVEISTIEGHLLAYGIPSLPPVRHPIDETIAWIRAHGGEPVLAHPFRRSHGVGGRTAQRVDVTAVETLNGQTSPRANRSADALADDRHLARIAGSDGHTAPGLGRAYTTFEERPASPDDVLEAIRRGRTHVGGASLGFGGRLRWGLRNAMLRTARGFRAV
ncbi:MAG: CehA/McbA family metallohydrolase [Thermoplasmata archaeon]